MTENKDLIEIEQNEQKDIMSNLISATVKDDLEIEQVVMLKGGTRSGDFKLGKMFFIARKGNKIFTSPTKNFRLRTEKLDELFSKPIVDTWKIFDEKVALNSWSEGSLTEFTTAIFDKVTDEE